MDMVNLFKQLASEQAAASQPATVRTGSVTSITPLTILVDQKLALTEEFLILTNECKDHEVEMTFNWQTKSKSGGGGEAAFSSHSHDIQGKTTVTVHNALAVGDKVVLVQQAGGQKFLVVGKVKEA